MMIIVTLLKLHRNSEGKTCQHMHVYTQPIGLRCMKHEYHTPKFVDNMSSQQHSQECRMAQLNTGAKRVHVGITALEIASCVLDAVF